MKAENASSDISFEHAVGQCKKDGYLKGVVDKEDFIMAYKPQFTWEDDLRYERGLEVLRAVIRLGISDENLLVLIKEVFQPAEADTLIGKLQQGQAAILT